MIERVSTSAVSTTADSGTGTTTQRSERQTPFGKVMIDELAATNVFGLVTGSRSAEPSLAPAPTAPAAAPAASADPAPPTAESLFGPNPWMTAPVGAGPLGQYGHNPVYFATRQTAEKVATMLGGKVVERNFLTPYGPFQQQNANLMIEMPNGSLTVAGLVADYFAHGYTQETIDRLLQSEILGGRA